MYQNRTRPRVKKFMRNIYTDVFYNESAVNDYVNSWYTGYAMSDYAFAD